MTPGQRKFAISLARSMLGEEQVQRILAMPFDDQGFGYDRFGQEKETGLLAYLAMRWLYTKYFRVESRGHENVPDRGRAILAGNHSGLLPFDGTMIGIDLLERHDPPRAMRALADNFLADLPYLGLFISRCGQVVGHPRNFARLLDLEELVIVFPEGAKGLGKPFHRRYQLEPFNVGFLEFSLQHRTPLIPFAVVGAEEQAPILFNAGTLGKRIGVPYFPITPTFPWLGPLGLFPYPVKYRIRYGEPVHYYREYGPDASERPELVEHLVGEFQQKVQELVKEERAVRKGVFR